MTRSTAIPRSLLLVVLLVAGCATMRLDVTRTFGRTLPAGRAA